MTRAQITTTRHQIYPNHHLVAIKEVGSTRNIRLWRQAVQAFQARKEIAWWPMYNQARAALHDALAARDIAEITSTSRRSLGPTASRRNRPTLEAGPVSVRIRASDEWKPTRKSCSRRSRPIARRHPRRHRCPHSAEPLHCPTSTSHQDLCRPTDPSPGGRVDGYGHADRNMTTKRVLIPRSLAPEMIERDDMSSSASTDEPRRTRKSCSTRALHPRRRIYEARTEHQTLMVHRACGITLRSGIAAGDQAQAVINSEASSGPNVPAGTSRQVQAPPTVLVTNMARGRDLDKCWARTALP